MIMTPEKLKEILDAHKEWLLDNSKGQRANLRSADLSSANLRSANLSSANLRSANLHFADLSSANLHSANLHFADLRSANLSSANLHSANLHFADLSSANLHFADLSSANLHFADLSSADLSSANLDFEEIKKKPWGRLWLAQNTIIPQGTIEAWKKVKGNILLKLEIPTDALRINAIGARKCRVSKAKVISAEKENGEAVEEREFQSCYKSEFIYRVGETVEEKLNESITEECASGIHVFLTREEALQFYL